MTAQKTAFLRALSLALLLLLGRPACAASDACAPELLLPAVYNADAETLHMVAPDGVCLQEYDWRPRKGPAKGVLVLVHGLKDHATRYAGLVDALAARGIAVLAQDHRGHGYSGGSRQRFDSIEELAGDVHLAVREAQRRYPGVPVFLFGHSLGGLAAVHYAQAHPGVLRGVALSAPFLALAPGTSRLDILSARVFGHVTPGLPLLAVDYLGFVREEAARAALAKDPLIDAGRLPAASALALLDGVEAFAASPTRILEPLLVMHGSADAMAPIAGSRVLVAQAATTDKALVEIAGAYHDLWHEPEAAQLQTQLAQWVAERVPERADERDGEHP